MQSLKMQQKSRNLKLIEPPTTTILQTPAEKDDEEMSITSTKSFATTNYGARIRPCRKVGYQNPVVAEREQRAVRMSKAAVMLVLALAVVAMAICTYQLVSQEEYDDYTDQFQSYASEIIAVSQENVKNSFGAIETFSVSISSYALDTGKRWPFVTIPHYHTKASRIAKQAGASSFIYAPVVYEEDRLEFEKKSLKNIVPVYKQAIDYTGSKTPVETFVNMTHNYIFGRINGTFAREDEPGPWPVLWQMTPWFDQIPYILTMNNIANSPQIADAYETMIATRAPALSIFNRLNEGNMQSQVFFPIFDKIHEGREDKKLVGVLWVIIDFQSYFSNLLPDSAKGIIVVLKSSCNDVSVTYKINGPNVDLLGVGDLHDVMFDEKEVSAAFVSLDDDVVVPEGRCAPELSLHLYPTEELRDDFITDKATIYTAVVVAIFLFTTLVFTVYDFTVRRRQQKVMERIIKQDKIVSNLFPTGFKDRLYLDSEGDSSSYGILDNESQNGPKGNAMADLFPSVTVFFADIAGFTAWSSQREPAQVFTLLESIFLEFDKIANFHDVFKIETVGDAYVAAAGLPEPRKDHAYAMAKFARDCMLKAAEVTKRLEVTLGPDTADLEMRMGLNSGQVTAGVLRGDRSRFQLFGDTVNTASRMESTSMRSKIQLSNSTAALLRKCGKSKWVVPRDEKVFVKGKGEMQTYWLETKTGGDKEGVGGEMPSIVETEESSAYYDEDFKNETDLSKTERLVEWNVDVLSKLLQQILAARDKKRKVDKKIHRAETKIGKGTTVLEEFQEIITLPKIKLGDLERRSDPKSIELNQLAVSQLRDFISKIASMYRFNEFHNFEHASHVTASVRKLLSRIVSFDNSGVGQEKGLEDVAIEDLVSHSYGITSDPLTQFSVVFSAVIHDLDHAGVPNTQLVKEKVPIASLYKEKSVAEQNSVDLAWDLLMRPAYKDLRACIYSNEDELKRFRQLVVNTVMATDICDKELQSLRKARWAKAFSDTPVDSSPEEDMNRKATIVIEHLIQASDVSHTMQHWQIYKKWNELFFMECYSAYRAGRADNDPSLGWYNGEIGFFDFYIIPLAKKLESCGVFGVSSHEYLNYAEANREEWAREGDNIVKSYIEKYNLLHGVQ